MVPADSSETKKDPGSAHSETILPPYSSSCQLTKNIVLSLLVDIIAEKNLCYLL